MRPALAALAALLLAPGAGATLNLTAIDARVGDHPAFVRVVVEFTDGDLAAHEVTLLDPGVWGDGRARIEVAHERVRAEVGPLRAEGVGVRPVQGDDRIVVRLGAAPHRFKYVSYLVLAAPERLVIDLWKARAPSAAATRRDDGCLRLTRFSVASRVEAAGRELRPLFEHSLVVRLRGSTGRLIAERPLIAAAGRWRAAFGYSVARAQRGTLEGAVQSAKDGALDCLVQVPVALAPGELSQRRRARRGSGARTAHRTVTICVICAGWREQKILYTPGRRKR